MNVLVTNSDFPSLAYLPETGHFIRLVSTSSRALAGQRAGGKRGNGYRYIHANGRAHLEHRLAVYFMKGRWPSQGVDHADGRTDNNAWGNLREADQSLNSANKRPSKKSFTGLKGVHRNRHRFCAQITVAGHKKHLGVFDTAQAAHEAYCAAALEHFGKYARMS